MAYEQFTPHFLNEVLKLALVNKDVASIVAEHLQFSLIPVELKSYKIVLKKFVDYYKSTNRLPTSGILTQSIQDPDVYDTVSKIIETKLPDKDLILQSLEDYIKRVKFQKLYTQIAEKYNNGGQEEAIELQAQESQKIVNFSIKGKTSYFEDVFDGFKERDDNRFNESQIGEAFHQKVPFGIDLLDSITFGGSEPGETDCFLGRSGSGKTKYLRWRGVSAARLGFKVLHIQAEGTKKECMDGYDCTWTAMYKRDIKSGNIPPEMLKRFDKIISDIRNKGGSIKVVAFEQFDTVSMRDVRSLVLDYYKIEGCFPDLLILDYLELFDPGNGKRYATSTEGEKYRREATARSFKNICNEFKIRGATASQANDIAPADYNRQDFVMTRHNTAGAKGLPDSFSYFLTWNVTSEEYEDQCGRLHIDKCREYKGKQTIRMCTAFDRDRFYDRARTIREFSEDYEG